jgi:hypothetical protein
MIRILFLTLITTFACSEDKPDDNISLHVLFIGNSLTYANDLPTIVQQIAMQANQKVITKSITVGGYSLEDHWNDNIAAAEIRQGKYDFVIFQQGPSALPESQVLLLNYAQKFVDVCNAANSKPIMYMVWPSLERSFDLDNVIISYTNTANNTSSGLAPAGLAWKNAWLAKASLPLYSEDNFHPSRIGSLLAAMTVFGAITSGNDFSFLKLENSTWTDQVSKADFELLKEAATKSLAR